MSDLRLCSLALAVVVLSSLVGCELDMRRQKVEDRITMHDGSSWTMHPEDQDTQIPPDHRGQQLLMVQREYVFGREVFLSNSAFHTDTGKSVDLYLINRSLTCEPRFPNQAYEWACAGKYDDLSANIPAIDPDLGKCVVIWSQFQHRPNFVGVIHAEYAYCVFVTVYEVKECGKGCQHKEKTQFTNINTDSIGILIVDADVPGPGGGGGGIVGGPRPRFSSPTSSVPAKSGGG
jgi:hypothetical protein